jgi:hypothetical protein
MPCKRKLVEIIPIEENIKKKQKNARVTFMKWGNLMLKNLIDKKISLRDFITLVTFKNNELN